MCLKCLLCDQGAPPVIKLKKKTIKAIDNALKVLQNRILHKNSNQNITHKKIYQNKTNIKKNTSHIRHTNTTQHKVQYTLIEMLLHILLSKAAQKVT